MGWTREARAHTSPVFGEMEATIPTMRKAVMSAHSRGLTVAAAVKRVLINNRYTSATSYINSAKTSYVHKLPTITQTSPLRNADYFLSLAFPEGTPTITGTAYTVASAMDQLDAVQSPIGTYDASVHSYTYTESGASFTKAYSSVSYVDDTTFTYIETVLNNSSTVISTTTKIGYRSVGHNIKVVRYSYTHLGLAKVKLYTPALTDAHLFHDIFSTYTNSDDFVAYPIYPLMLDSVFIDHASRKAEYDDAKDLLTSLSFPIVGVFEAIKEGIPTDVGASENHITDVFLLNAININSTTQAGRAYLFEFFDAIYLNHVDPSTGSATWTQSNYSVNISESDYNFKLQFDSITNTVESGARTTYDSTIVAGQVYEFQQLEIDVPSGSITLYAPSAPGATTHRKLVIAGVIAHTVVDYPSGATKTVTINVSTDNTHLDYDNFCIPLIHGVVAQLPTLEMKEQVFVESFVIVSHSLTEYYLKWYQAIWRAIKKYVIIAITVLIALYIQDGGTTAAAFYAAFATAVAINMVLEIVLEMIDDPYLKALVILAVSYYGTTAGGESGFDFSNFSLSDPMQLINVVGAVGNAYLTQQMKDLQLEMQDFVKDSKELWEDLKEKQDMLEESEYSELIVANIIAGVSTYEAPTSFFARTLTQNPGVLVYDQLETFYDNKLRLPELSPMGAS